MPADIARGCACNQSCTAFAGGGAGRSLVNEGKGVGIGVIRGGGAGGGGEGSAALMTAGAGGGDGMDGKRAATELDVRLTGDEGDEGDEGDAAGDEASHVAGCGTGVRPRGGREARERSGLGDAERDAGAGGAAPPFSSANSRVASGRS